MWWEAGKKEILQFHGGGSHPVQYFLDDYQGHYFYIRYRRGWLSVERDELEIFAGDVWCEDDNEWNRKETNYFLLTIGDAIQEEMLDKLLFAKNVAEMCGHSYYCDGPYQLRYLKYNNEHKSELWQLITADEVEQRRKEHPEKIFWFY